MDWQHADALAAQHGASFFLLDEARFRANFTAFQAAFANHYPDVQIGYSYKTNYTPFLCKIVHELGGFAEVVSNMEYALAQRIGVSGPRIIFNGPYKARAAFEEALLAGSTINLDSLRDIEMLEAIAPAHPDHDFALVIRCNFPLSDGEISRFGMDVDGPEFAQALSVLERLPNTRLKGLHCHFPDRDLASFGRRAETMVALMRRLFPDGPPEVVNIGGGYFSNMPEALRQTFSAPPATFGDYGGLIGGILSKAVAGQGRPPTLFLEPGTAIVADVQRFFTRVLSTKAVHGRHVASMAGSIFDISPTARSTKLPVSILSQGKGGVQASWDLGGYTCIEGDLMSLGLDAAIAPGDFAVFGNVGSYSIVMRPAFILPANPILAERPDGTITLVKARESVDDVFQNFVF